jgi:hypothetical protein
MEYKYGQQFGDFLVAATPSGDSVILEVTRDGGESVFHFDPAEAEKIGRALVAVAYAARPALVIDSIDAYLSTVEVA